MELDAGDVFFTSKARNNIGPKGTSYVESTYKGYIAAIAIGWFDKGEYAPNPNETWRLIGAAGLVGLDHVEECLGKEALAKLQKYFIEKFPTRTEEIRRAKKEAKEAAQKDKETDRPG